MSTHRQVTLPKGRKVKFQLESSDDKTICVYPRDLNAQEVVAFRKEVRKKHVVEYFIRCESD